MNAPRGAEGKPGNRPPKGDNNQQPLAQEPQPQNGTPFFPDLIDAPTIPPRLVEFLPRAGTNALVSLLKRGLPTPVAEDIVQEVAYRAVRNGIDPSSARSLVRWMHVASHNRATSWLRANEREAQRRALFGDLEVLVASDDTPSHVEQRAFLRAVAVEFERLRQADKEVIRTAANEMRPQGTKRDRDRFALRLHRARLRLEARLRDWLVVITLRLRLDDFLAGAQHIAPLTAAIGVAGASAVLGVAATTAPAAASEDATHIAQGPLDVTGSQGAVPPPTRTVPLTPIRHDQTNTSTTTAPPAVRPTPAVSYQYVDVRASEGSGAEAATTEIPPNAPLLCLTNMPSFGTNCIAHPLRK